MRLNLLKKWENEDKEKEREIEQNRKNLEAQRKKLLDGVLIIPNFSKVTSNLVECDHV